MAWTEGACVVDTRTGRVGRITGRSGTRLTLSPLSAGRSWDCPLDRVREATDFERRNADVLDVTWRFWRRRATAAPNPAGATAKGAAPRRSGNAG